MWKRKTARWKTIPSIFAVENPPDFSTDLIPEKIQRFQGLPRFFHRVFFYDNEC